MIILVFTPFWKKILIPTGGAARPKFHYIEVSSDFRDVLVSSIDSDITYEGLIAEMKDICRFDEHQPFTMKWVDEEGGSVFYSHLFEHCCACTWIYETIFPLNNNFTFC